MRGSRSCSRQRQLRHLHRRRWLPRHRLAIDTAIISRNKMRGTSWIVAVISRIHLLTVAAVASAVFCSACSGRLAQGALSPVAEANTEGTSLVPLLVATTRKQSTDTGNMFDR